MTADEEMWNFYTKRSVNLDQIIAELKAAVRCIICAAPCNSMAHWPDSNVYNYCCASCADEYNLDLIPAEKCKDDFLMTRNNVLEIALRCQEAEQIVDEVQSW